MGIYNFDPEDAMRFAREQGIRTSRKGDELIFLDCPYCHSAKDKKTFAINLKTGMFKCLRASCGASGNMLTLHRDFGFDLGNNVREYERSPYSWRRFKTPEERIESSNPAVAYLTGRGISEEVVRRYEITTKKGTDNILVFPFFNENGSLEFIKYRKTDFDPEKDKNKEWCEADCRAILFGMKQCVDFQRLIITEGQIDSMSVATAGFNNAVSVPTGKNGMTWVPHCWNWLKNFQEIVVFGDYERGAMTLLPDIRSRFECRILSVQPEDYRGCKDANELLQKYGADAIRNAIKNAKPEMLDQVKVLSEISYSSEKTEEQLPTGVKAIDDLLEGGLAFGYLDILTGKRGEGKSTEGSMILKSALEHGYNCFIYSGEMKTGDVKKWLDFQIAGSRRIIGEQIGDYTKYKLSDQNIERIRMWYKDRAYIYDTSVVTEMKMDLLDVVETYIKEFGCRVVLIDNLMTAIDLTSFSGDKFEKQELICKRLARMAQKFNALILLVAHKKKTDPKFANDENDDVLGSSEITNLAGVIMSYERDKNLDDSQRRLKITKNRLTGRVNFNGFVMEFNQASKRVYGFGQREDYDSPCFLEKVDPDGFQPADDLEIPF